MGQRGKAQKKAGGVIRNPDFPDLGILRRSLSKKRREERGERGQLGRNNWTLAAFSPRNGEEGTGRSIGARCAGKRRKKDKDSTVL